MLTNKQIEEIREHLENAQNPIFFYDNDADGLCSFLLLRKFLGRGKGVAIRGSPELNLQYAKKAEELGADYVFILDKPIISDEFVDFISALNLPIVWIDHHDLKRKKFSYKNMYSYNPTHNKGKDKSSEPVTYLSYSITKRKEDMWVAVMGCIADHFMPDFALEFAKHYPEFWASGLKEPFDAYYGSEIGRIAQAVGFGLKDSASHTIEMQNFLLNCRQPSDVFSEMESNNSFRSKYYEMKKKFDYFVEKAGEEAEGKLIFYQYGGDMSMSAEISNKLCYLYPDKYIVVAYIKEGISNLSLRGKGVKKMLEKIIGRFENATGGGHEDAVGARVKSDDLIKFREAIAEEIK